MTNEERGELYAKDPDHIMFTKVAIEQVDGRCYPKRRDYRVVALVAGKENAMRIQNKLIELLKEIS